MKNKGFIQGLYDMAAGAPDENGIPKLDEQKLRRELDKNDRLLRNNKDIFEEKEPKTKTCPRYNPCPICSKCLNKASHLYVSCQTCQIPICSHTYENRENMIKRKNFTQYVTKEIMDEIHRIDREVIGDGNC
jgi:hypothetical protein